MHEGVYISWGHGVSGVSAANRNNPVNYVDPSGLYVFANGTAEQQKAFNAALRIASSLPQLKDVTSFYGAPGVENGVVIRFDKNIVDPITKSDILSDVTPLSTVHIPISSEGNELIIIIAHEGSHIADWKNYVNALKEAFFRGDYNARSVIGNDLIDLTSYAAEVKAYGYSITAAIGLGLKSLSYYGYEIMRNGQPNRKSLNMFLAKYYGISPENPGSRLSQR